MSDETQDPERMGDEILNAEVIEESLLTPNELLAYLLEDLIAGRPADDVAWHIIDDFILAEREETPQILAMLEMDSATLAPLLKTIALQVHQEALNAIDGRGVAFIDELKSSVKSHLSEVAEKGEA
ncbi:MAG: hypothetical protein QM785_12380 [Pyrinomonadaceae bacterium]